MAIFPDALGDDKTLSDAGDKVEQGLKLPDALRVEAHNESLPASTLKSDLLPQLTLTQPINLPEAVAPTSGIRLDTATTQPVTPKPIEVASATLPPVQVDNLSTQPRVEVNPATLPAAVVPTIGISPDTTTVQPVTSRPIEVASATLPPVQADNLSTQPRVEVNPATLAAAVTPTTGIRFDTTTAQPAVTKPIEVASATVPPVQVDNLSTQPRVEINPTILPAAVTPTTGIRFDSATAQPTVTKPIEVASATVPPVQVDNLSTQPKVEVNPATLPAAVVPTIGISPDTTTVQPVTSRPIEVASATLPPVQADNLSTQPRVEVNPATLPAAVAPTTGIRFDTATAQSTLPKPIEVATATLPPVQADKLPSQPRVEVDPATLPAAVTPTTGIRFDTAAAQPVTSRPIEVASATLPPVQADKLPSQPRVEINPTALPAAVTSTTGIRFDTATAQVITAKPIEVAAANPAPVISATQPDSHTPAKVLDKLASSATAQPQFPYVGQASPKSESSTETTNVIPAQRIHTNPQLAMTREATQGVPSGVQSYTAASLPQELKPAAVPSEKDSRTVTLPPGSVIATPVARDVAGAVRVNDPQTLLTAMENMATSHKASTSTTGSVDGIVPTGKPLPPALQGTHITDVPGTKQDALTSPLIKMDVHGRVLPPVDDTRMVQTAGVSSLDGRVVQNVIQPGQHGISPDVKPGTTDTRKVQEVTPTTPGHIGPGTPTGKEHDDTKRILDVPNLNLDDKTQQTGEKGKTRETSQPDVDESTRTQTKTEAELVDLLDRAKKDKKEQPEEGDKVDANTTATAAATQQWINSKRLEHKVRKGETLDLISRKYFGDDIASTLIVELNALVLNPRIHEHRVIISLPVDLIITIPFPNEIERFRKQLVAGTKTRMNIVYE